MAKSNNGIVRWDEEMAKEAAVAAGMEESAATGQFFSTAGGQLKWNDAPLPDNQMAVVILDHVLENVFYEGAYDPDEISGPACFAFGRDEREMAPHANVVAVGTQQSEKCADCENNEWGSSDKGRGKACRNTRRLAMVPAGQFKDGKFVLNTSAEHYKTTQVGYLRLPVTSVKGFAAFVKQVAGALKRPPAGVATRVKVVPDSKTQFKVTFEPLAELPASLIPAVMSRRKEVSELISFPYQPREEAATPKKGKKSNGKSKRY